MKRKLVSVDHRTNYLNTIKQMIAELLLSHYKDKKSSGHVNSPWTVPNMITGMYRQDDQEQGDSRVMAGRVGEGRRKRKNFIKKTVVPYPRLG